MKLDTDKAVLEWAVDVGRDADQFGIDRDDTETAARLALAMRVLAIVERERGSMFDADRIVCTAILAEASAKQGEGK